MGSNSGIHFVAHNIKDFQSIGKKDNSDSGSDDSTETKIIPSNSSTSGKKKKPTTALGNRRGLL